MSEPLDIESLLDQAKYFQVAGDVVQIKKMSSEQAAHAYADLLAWSKKRTWSDPPMSYTRLSGSKLFKALLKQIERGKK